MLLKKTLLANAVFSSTCGLLMVILSSQLAALLGQVPSWLVLVIGVGLLIFAADVYWIARKLPQSVGRAKIILWADVAWVVLTPLVLWLFSSALSATGIIVLLDIAAIVAVFAFLEWKGLQRSKLQFA